MRDLARLALLFAAAAASGASAITGGPGAPKPDKCSGSEAGDVALLEVGAGDERSFMPLEDGAAVHLIQGSQGADMFALRFRLSGPNVPDCISQETELRFCPESLDCDSPMVMASSDVKLKTYEEPDGSRATQVHFLILSGDGPAQGAPMELSVTAAGLTETRLFYFGIAPADAGALDAM